MALKKVMLSVPSEGNTEFTSRYDAAYCIAGLITSHKKVIFTTEVTDTHFNVQVEFVD